jgi:hypothetical protein
VGGKLVESNTNEYPNIYDDEAERKNGKNGTTVAKLQRQKYKSIIKPKQRMNERRNKRERESKRKSNNTMRKERERETKNRNNNRERGTKRKEKKRHQQAMGRENNTTSGLIY